MIRVRPSIKSTYKQALYDIVFEMYKDQILINSDNDNNEITIWNMIKVFEPKMLSIMIKVFEIVKALERVKKKEGKTILN